MTYRNMLKVCVWLYLLANDDDNIDCIRYTTWQENKSL